MMLALSWCGGCGGKGEGPNNDIQELAAAVWLMDRAIENSSDAQRELFKTPDDPEFKKMKENQDRQYGLYKKRAEKLLKKIEAQEN